jgi:signal transduction histidine kinase/DNA-binding response OmpR family regulator
VKWFREDRVKSKPSKMPIRILIADDHASARHAISSVLAACSGWQVCGEASDGVDAVAQAEKLHPDVILMDVTMPRMNGLEAALQVRRLVPTAKVVIVSQNDPSVLRQQAEIVKADGYVAKDQITRQLIPSITGLFPEAESDPTERPALEQGAAWSQSGGEMGELIRNTNWSQTPLGPANLWSPALRMIIKFLLANRFPQLLWWGKDLCSIYNDAYIPILGTKHPQALGRPVREVWSEIWDVLRPLIETPFYGGPATWMEDIPLEINRRGFFEETHFTIAYSPVPDESVPGGIGGVLATVHEITEKVVAERRVRSLRDLGARSVEPRTAGEACVIIRDTLSAHPKDLPFLLLYLLDKQRSTAELACRIGADQDDRACPQFIDLGSVADEVWPISETLASESIQVVEDLESRFDTVPKGPWQDAPKSAVVLPIRSNLQHQLAGFMIAGISSRLEFDSGYRDFLELIQNQIAITIANARAYEQERKRAETLAEIDRAKTHFFSNVSHEFRTPLTLMLGPIEDFLANDKSLSEEDRNKLQIVHRNSLRLLKLVNTLLDFSRIEAGRIEAFYQASDLPVLTAELASMFRSTIEGAGLKLSVDCPPISQSVYIDREMWEKIVFNLLSNAFKFTFNGEIHVFLEEIADGVELRVRDTGTGIPAKDLPHLFERFYRVPGAQGRTWEGSGIGLALVQELAKLHGGSVRVESEQDRGSCFIVTVPFGKSHLPEECVGIARTQPSVGVQAEAYLEEALRGSPPSAAIVGNETIPNAGPPAWIAAEPRQRPTVLIADDNADMRQYLESTLETLYQVVLCEDGQVALEQARLQRPDLILADVMMPRRDGFSLLRSLRQDKRLCDVPVILLSARAGEESRIEGLDAGADNYLVKPFSARELMARVGSQLAMATVRQEAAELKGRHAEMLRQSKRVRELSWRLLRAQDDERRRIARELHDSAGQTLTVLGINLAQLVQRAGRIAPELASESERALEMVQQLHRDIRTTSYLLHPPLLDENGLYSALTWYVQGVADRSNLNITLDMSQDFGRLPREMELVVFRLVQECLTNIHRHSGSATASIRIARDQDLILAEVRDQGQGIAPHRLLEIQSGGSGVGIQGIRERLRQFEGEMKIESEKGGTRISVSIPAPALATKEEETSPDSIQIAV